MTAAYSEDRIVEQSAIALFAELGWRQKVQSRAKVKVEIEDVLDALPRAYSKALYESKCTTAFEHVYESCRGDGGSVYRDAA